MTKCLLAIVATFGLAGAATAATPDVELWRLDCGEFPNFDISGMSDVFAYQGRKKTLTNSCYLIRHGSQYLLWDTGFPPSMLGKAPKLTEQLARISIQPEQISIVAISHFHFDHTGQLPEFSQARLMIGRVDWETFAQNKPVTMPDHFAPWLAPGAKVQVIAGDTDVFGDGSVIMLRTPGHTAGHHSLLIQLPKYGAVILGGDLWHISEQREDNGVKTDDLDVANLRMSRDRILQIASRLKAKIIIQHEPADIAKLPQFPASAR